MTTALAKSATARVETANLRFISLLTRGNEDVSRLPTGPLQKKDSSDLVAASVDFVESGIAELGAFLDT